MRPTDSHPLAQARIAGFRRQAQRDALVRAARGPVVMPCWRRVFWIRWAAWGATVIGRRLC
jgi:hypothetical protein